MGLDSVGILGRDLGPAPADPDQRRRSQLGQGLGQERQDLGVVAEDEQRGLQALDARQAHFGVRRGEEAHPCFDLAVRGLEAHRGLFEVAHRAALIALPREEAALDRQSHRRSRMQPQLVGDQISRVEVERGHGGTQKQEPIEEQRRPAVGVELGAELREGPHGVGGSSPRQEACGVGAGEAAQRVLGEGRVFRRQQHLIWLGAGDDHQFAVGAEVGSAHVHARVLRELPPGPGKQRQEQRRDDVDRELFIAGAQARGPGQGGALHGVGQRCEDGVGWAEPGAYAQRLEPDHAELPRAAGEQQQAAQLSGGGGTVGDAGREVEATPGPIEADALHWAAQRLAEGLGQRRRIDLDHYALKAARVVLKARRASREIDGELDAGDQDLQRSHANTAPQRVVLEHEIHPPVAQAELQREEGLITPRRHRILRAAPGGTGHCTELCTGPSWAQPAASLKSRERSYSHSIVAGGFEEMSYTTRLIPPTSLMMRVEIRPRTS